MLNQHGLLKAQEQSLAAQLLAEAEVACIGRAQHFVERVAF
jgi:hypothetical protein